MPDRYVFREAEINQLSAICNDFCSPSPVLVYGHSSTGKTSVVKSVLDQLELVYAYVNCTDCSFSVASLFADLIQQVSERLDLEANVDTLAKCRDVDCVNEFVSQLRLLLAAAATEAANITLVFDNAERLCQLPSPVFLSLTRLAELVNFRVCVIFISILPFTKFQHRSSTSEFSPISIFFRSYTNDELVEIMSLDGPKESKFAKLYETYCRLIVSIISPICRDLNELRYIASDNFEKYVEPIRTGEVDESDTRKLYRAFEPTLKQCVQKPFLRDVSSTVAPQPTTIVREAVEFPLNTKMLLLAAYLASYHPPSMDKRLFALNHGKARRNARITQQQRTEKEKFFSKGPRLFGLDRLLSIYTAVVEDINETRTFAASAEMLNQITSLVSLGFLIQVGQFANLDVPKYKCCASREFVQSIARNVGFALADYLLEPEKARAPAATTDKVAR